MSPPGFDSTRLANALICRDARGLADSSVMVTVDDARRVALSVPGTTEHLIDPVKFWVKRLV